MIRREVLFWRQKAERGQLTASLRAFPKRAIRFFGAYAVLCEHEGILFATLEAYEIAQTPTKDLMARMKKLCRSRSSISVKDITNMKKKAQEHLSKTVGSVGKTPK